MKIGVLLLNSLNVYVGHDGSLPRRPRWDKDFLLDLCRGKVILASANTLSTLPKSLLKIMAGVQLPIGGNAHYDINLGIATFKTHPVDLLFVVRGNCRMSGKVFRLDSYTKIYEDEKGLELWTLRN